MTSELNKHLQLLRALPLAGLDFIRALLAIPGWLRLADQPQAESRVPEDYIGINIATSDDPSVDSYVLEKLHQLNIGHARMDFSYDSIDGPAQRLLERLLEEGIQVMLEVFPPLGDAEILFRDGPAQQRWVRFLQHVFTTYRGSVQCFEIGSTPNRGRWSGFSFLSYQAAWGFAVEQASLTGTSGEKIVLAGPNISDFEPLYNASFLSYMKRFGRSPEIHTDNLFVERVVEPEAYDHRVFGQFATHTLKLNLLKKARILKRIGQDNGSPENSLHL